MKIRTVLLVVLACSTLATLGGCASMSKKGDPSAMVPDSNSDTTDTAYVQQVDRRAQEIGTRVVWVNPPDKPRHN